jgi:hypothetical protein
VANQIVGDTTPELADMFMVERSNTGNALIEDGTEEITITDND